MISQLASAAGQILREQLGNTSAALTYAHPICRVVVDGRDITADITARLVSITLTDNRGM